MPIPFLQAKHFTRGPRTRVDLIVIHSAEIGETLEGAEALMKACAVSDRIASWHYAADADSITQSVREEDIAFHAPGANNNGVGIELTGRASQSAADWADDFSRNMLVRVVDLAAGICSRWNIPAQLVDEQGLLDGRRGITTHAMVSRAFKKSDHTDPGANFPLADVVARVASVVRAASVSVSVPVVPGAPPPVGLGANRPVLKAGAKGTAVAELQRRLNSAGTAPALIVDGDFGAATQTALVIYQQVRGLPETAAADAATWTSLFA